MADESHSKRCYEKQEEHEAGWLREMLRVLPVLFKTRGRGKGSRPGPCCAIYFVDPLTPAMVTGVLSASW